MKIIDLRSDTVTHPTPEMRKAMFEAEVGDDVYWRRPHCQPAGKNGRGENGQRSRPFHDLRHAEQSDSGSDSNHRGDEIILGSESHIFWYEVGGAAALGGVVMRTLPNDKSGQIDPNAFENSIRPHNIHSPETTLTLP